MEIEEMQALLDVDPPEGLWGKIEAGIEKLEKKRERSRIWSAKNRKENPEKVKEQQQKWAADNPEKKREGSRVRSAKSRAKNLEKVRASQNEWRKSARKKNPEKFREQARSAGAKETMNTWKKNNPERLKEYARKWDEKNPIKVLINQVKARAKRNGLDFDLKESDIVVPEFCPVLGLRLEWGTGKGRKVALDNSVSLDRTDSSKGYIKGNISIMSWRANNLKKNGTAEEHAKIAEYMKGIDARNSNRPEAPCAVGTESTP